jgi:hypothetical protein
MANGINVTQTAREFLASVDAFAKRDINRAVAMAINRTADGARVDANREIRSRYKLKVATVNKAFSIKRASADSLTAIIRVRGQPLNLGNFQPRQTRKGVSVNVKGTRKLIPHAFILNVRTRDGENTFGVVFIRDLKNGARPGRLPIKPLTSVDVPGLFILEDINQVVRVLAVDRFRDEFPAALRAITSGR